MNAEATGGGHLLVRRSETTRLRLSPGPRAGRLVTEKIITETVTEITEEDQP